MLSLSKVLRIVNCRDGNYQEKSPIRRPPPSMIPKRSASNTVTRKPREPSVVTRRRCQSLSPPPNTAHPIPRGIPEHESSIPKPHLTLRNEPDHLSCTDKECSLPQCVVLKMLRSLAMKKREFIKLKKSVAAQQNTLLEQYAALKDLENKVGTPVDDDDVVGDVRIVSVSNWPAHDLLLLVREDLRMPIQSEIGGILGPEVLQQLHAQLTPIPEEVLGIGAEVMARRIDVLNLLRGKHARHAYSANLEQKAKNTEMDLETERLHRLVAATVENIKAKISYSLELAKIPWLDRDSIVRKSERLQKENTMLQHKLQGVTKKPSDHAVNINRQPHNPALEEELKKERAAREALKDVVSAAEGMLRVARGRITTLEKQLKDNKTELDAARKKLKELDNLYRHRETNYDARSKKLIQNSKTGEMTIETLSRQRDALEIRFQVKELREQATEAAKFAEAREAELRSKLESFQAKLADNEKRKEGAEAKVVEAEDRIRNIEAKLATLREHSSKLLEFERRCCLDYIPSKENEPTDRETEIWNELQATRRVLAKTEEKLRLARADKEDFLDSLSKIAAEGVDNLQGKMSAVLLEKEQKINKLQYSIEAHKENEKNLELKIAHYESKLNSLRVEITRLRNYDCFAKDIPYQELHTQLLDLHMQLETLRRERSALVSAAASRALMLERHERAADMFARVIRAKHDILAILEGRSEPPSFQESTQSQSSRSLSSLCTAAANTWSALRAERARVLRLESAVLSQSLQLEREGRVRTQLERRRALLEREMLRAQALSINPEHHPMNSPSVVQNVLYYR